MKSAMLYGFVAAMFLTACQTTPVPPAAEPSPPAVVKPAPPAAGEKIEFKGEWKNAEWDAFLLGKIREQGLHKVVRLSDAAKYCPQFSALTEAQKENFWATFVVAMTYRESGYNPNSFMYECRKKTKDGKACSSQSTCHNPYSDARWDEARGWCMKGDPNVDGGYVISTGLLQMSASSASSSKYNCGKQTFEKLKDPKNNLNCGLNIIGKWVKEDKWAGSTTGVDPMTYRGCARYWSVCRNASDSQAYIKSKVRALSFCK